MSALLEKSACTEQLEIDDLDVSSGAEERVLGQGLNSYRSENNTQQSFRSMVFLNRQASDEHSISLKDEDVDKIVRYSWLPWEPEAIETLRHNSAKDFLLIHRLLEPIKEQESFIQIAKWQGRIVAVSIEEGTFVAQLKSYSNPTLIEQAEFDMDDVAETEQKLVSVGAIFYWTIGYKRTKNGGREKVSIIIMRRTPALSVDKPAIEGADKLGSLFRSKQQ
jgi:hypothetical protein